MNQPSNGTPQFRSEQPEGPVLFFEESLGKKVARILSEHHTIRVVTHLEHFKPGEPDETWIPKCAEHGWIIITKDSRIRKREIELRAVRLSGARLFYFAYGRSTAEDYAASLVKAYPRMCREIENRAAPFIARISPSGLLEFIDL